MPCKHAWSQEFAPFTTRWTARSRAVPEKLRAEQGPGMIRGSSRRRPSRSTIGAASASIAAARWPSDELTFSFQATRRHWTSVHQRGAGLSVSALPFGRSDLTSQPQKQQRSEEEGASLPPCRSPTALRGEKRFTSFCFTLENHFHEGQTAGSGLVPTSWWASLAFGLSSAQLRALSSTHSSAASSPTALSSGLAPLCNLHSGRK